MPPSPGSKSSCTLSLTNLLNSKEEEIHTFWNTTEAYNQDGLLSGTPFVAIDLKNKTFGFIDFDDSSIYYSPVHVDGTIYKFHLDTPNEIINSRFINYNCKTFDLATINFYDISDLNNAIEIYTLEKADKIKRLPA